MNLQLKYQILLNTINPPCMSAVVWAEKIKYKSIIRLVLKAKKEWRQWVADNTSNLMVLTTLSADQHSEVRYAVAQNAATPTDILTTLSADQDWEVRCAVAQNAATPTDVLTTLSADQDCYVRYAVAQNAATPTDVLTILSADQYWDVRCAVAQNAATPTDVLTTLSADQDSQVRYFAKNKLYHINRQITAPFYCGHPPGRAFQ